MSNKDGRNPHIGLAIDTATTWGVNLIRGIHNYAAEHGPWELDLTPTGRFEPFRRPEGRERLDGILARVTTAARARSLLKFKVPVVNVASHDPTAGQIAHCSVNTAAVGSLAAAHFLDRGYRDFGYVTTGERRDNFHDQSLRAFTQALASQGCTLSVFESLAKSGRAREASGGRLIRWLQELPKPAAVLCWNAHEAFKVSIACRTAGIGVPTTVAILAGEYDELTCSLANPPLSAVDEAGDIVGWHAARLLDRLMRGGAHPRKPILTEPRGVIVRQSTDSLALVDPLVVRALTFIRENALSGIRVADVVRQVPLSRRGLELRFVQALGRSPAEEIRYVRVQHAREMLASTNFTVKRIARASSFANENLLARAFQYFHGQTPSFYRRRIRMPWSQR
ncbi:MAG: substrate-binding domain-containing protein [Planctomycetia bacterium]|nr:substrate-binding domain-containing protein [Planctomycetia bacterium]